MMHMYLQMQRESDALRYQTRRNKWTMKDAIMEGTVMEGVWSQQNERSNSGCDATIRIMSTKREGSL